MSVRGFVCVALVVLAFAAQAGDQQRELDYAYNLQNFNTVGRVEWLKAGEQRFLGLFTQAEKTDNSLAVIVLHDMGDHPDQLPLIHGLRAMLPQHNWASLAIQLPLREIGAEADDYYALFDEARARIQAAVAFLRDNGAQNIALVGYGMGGAMAAYSISLDPDALFALVTISLPMPNSTMPQAQTGDFIKTIALPFLDIYAEFDLPNVSDTARRRRMLAKDNPVYRQIKINGENHAYQHDPTMLIKRVYSWLALSLGPN